jgi:dTDP-4-amino-4,6-dideoxygalactose transaminase
VEGISMPFGAIADGTTSAQHLAVALVPAERRDDVRQGLSERRIQTSVHYPPIHLFSYYRELGSRRPLPRTEAVAPCIVTLPLYGHMTNEQVDLVVGALSETLRVA